MEKDKPLNVGWFGKGIPLEKERILKKLLGDPKKVNKRENPISRLKGDTKQ